MPARGWRKISAWGEEAVIFGGEFGHVAEPGAGAEFGAEAAQVLIDQPEVHFAAGDVGGFSGQIAADQEIGRSDGVLAEQNQDACIGGGDRS